MDDNTRILTKTSDIIREIRKPGPVEVVVIGVHDTLFIYASKKDLIGQLRQLDEDGTGFALHVNENNDKWFMRDYDMDHR
jgi:cytosine/adenosine deaminase-related metal-dependent hydrolase